MALNSIMVVLSSQCHVSALISSILTGCAPCDPVNRLNIQMVNGAGLVRLLDWTDSWWMACSNANEIQIYPIKSINRMLASINSPPFSLSLSFHLLCWLLEYRMYHSYFFTANTFTWAQLFFQTEPIGTYTPAHKHTRTHHTSIQVHMLKRMLLT